MGIGNAVEGIGAGLTGHPEDWKPEQKENEIPEQKEKELSGAALFLSKNAERITDMDFSQENQDQQTNPNIAPTGIEMG